MKKIIIFIIKAYQYFISPLLGNKCRFFPSCSEYFIEALKNQGLFQRFKIGFKRVLKCHPFKNLGGGEGIDFVSPVRKRKVKMDNKNVFVAIALSMSVLLFWGAFFETPRKPTDQKNKKVERKVEQNSISPTITQPQIDKKFLEKSLLVKSKNKN